QADSPAIEHRRRVTGTGGLSGGRPSKGVHARALDEELTLFGKKQAEPGQVDLLFVRFDLSKVRAIGEVGGDVLSDAISHVAAHVLRDVVRGLAICADV